jgi:hypothetical protein
MGRTKLFRSDVLMVTSLIKGGCSTVNGSTPREYQSEAARICHGIVMHCIQWIAAFAWRPARSV